MPVKIFDFKGKKPILTPRLLPLGYAQTAENVKLGSGAMESARSLGGSVHTPSGTPKTIYWFSSWLSWTTRRWIAKAAISGVERLLIAGGTATSYPTTQTAGGVSRRWGVVAPSAALTLHDQGTATEEAVVEDTVSYVYTLVTLDGEESKPSPASAAVDVMTGRYLSLDGWAVHSANQLTWRTLYGNDIAYIRVYRLVSDAAGNAEYQRVSLASSPTGTAVADIPIASVTGSDHDWYDVNASQDGLSQGLGAMIVTEGWDPPPDTMKGACMFANGMYAGYVGNIVYLSMPGYYYAFPASGTMDYTMELPFDVVAQAAFNESLMVGTTGFPEVISGTDAAFMTRTPLPYQQPCLSEKGMTSLPSGVTYVSPDGLFYVSSNGGDVITKNVIDRGDWNDLPLSSAILAYHDQKIFIFFEGYATGLIYDPALDYLVEIDLSGTLVRDVFVDPEADKLYIAGSSGVYQWEGGSSFLTAEWKSGVMETAPVNFAGCRVEGTFPNSSTTTITYYADGVEKISVAIAVSSVGVVTRTTTVDGVSTSETGVYADSPFRLPSGFRGRDHEINIVFSGATINAMYLSFNYGDLANV